MNYHHTTKMEKCCTHCGKPFTYFWKDKEERNGQSETMYLDKYHFECVEAATGKKAKTLHDLNEERK